LSRSPISFLEAGQARQVHPDFEVRAIGRLHHASLTFDDLLEALDHAGHRVQQALVVALLDVDGHGQVARSDQLEHIGRVAWLTAELFEHASSNPHCSGQAHQRGEHAERDHYQARARIGLLTLHDLLIAPLLLGFDELRQSIAHHLVFFRRLGHVQLEGILILIGEAERGDGLEISLQVLPLLRHRLQEVLVGLRGAADLGKHLLEPFRFLLEQFGLLVQCFVLRLHLLVVRKEHHVADGDRALKCGRAHRHRMDNFYVVLIGDGTQTLVHHGHAVDTDGDYRDEQNQNDPESHRQPRGYLHIFKHRCLS
jgi:hypothetical protein